MGEQMSQSQRDLLEELLTEYVNHGGAYCEMGTDENLIKRCRRSLYGNALTQEEIAEIKHNQERGPRNCPICNNTLSGIIGLKSHLKDRHQKTLKACTACNGLGIDADGKECELCKGQGWDIQELTGL
jgi:hypothetical protein